MQTNNAILKIIPELLNENEILSKQTFDKIKSVVNFEDAEVFMLSPESLEEIYPEKKSIKISS